MSTEAIRNTAPKVTIVRDLQNRQIAYIDTKVGLAAAVEKIGPSYQKIVLGGDPVSVFADHSLDRYVFAPLLLRGSLVNNHLQHLFDLPKKVYETDVEIFKFPDEIIDIRDGTYMGQDASILIDPPRPSETTANVESSSPDTNTTKSPRKRSATRAKVIKMRIKRPRNSWIIYRSEKSKQLHTDRPGMSAGAISTEVARLWKNETPEVKAYYGELAELEAQEHKLRYPDYRYTPGR